VALFPLGTIAYGTGKGGSGTTFTPAQLPGLNLWLDAADATTITVLPGNLVSQWFDKSANAYAYRQGIPSRQPTYVASGINGKGSISCTSNSSGGSNATALFDTWVAGSAHVLASGTTGWYCYVVFQPGDSSAQANKYDLIGFAMGPNLATYSPLLQLDSTTAYQGVFFGGSESVWQVPRVQGATFPINVPVSVGFQSSAGVSSIATMTAYLNGVSQSITATASDPGVYAPANQSPLGYNSVPYGDHQSGPGFDGLIAEVIVGNAALSVQDTAALAAYLTAKWGT
jgi:hypothetical protein